MKPKQKRLASVLDDHIFGKELANALKLKINLKQCIDYDAYYAGRHTTSIHEAGHAVVAHHFGMPIHSVCVFDPETPEAEAAAGVVHFSQPNDGWCESVKQREETPFNRRYQEADWLCARMAAIYLAGGIAELIAVEFELSDAVLATFCGSDDWRNAKHYAGEYKSDAVLLACQRVAIKILTANWEAVIKTAERVDCQGQVSGGFVSRILADAYAHTNEQHDATASINKPGLSCSQLSAAPPDHSKLHIE